MTYREVTMIETKEILRLWMAGLPKKQIARQLRVDPKTVRRYVKMAETRGLKQARGLEAPSDEAVAELLLRLRALPGRPPSETWARCAAWRASSSGDSAN